MSWLFADSAGVFVKGYIPDIVVSVFYAPMVANGVGVFLGGQRDLADVVGDLVGGVPEAGFGILVPSQTGDAGGGDDQAVPVRADTTGKAEDFNVAMLLAAMALAVDGLETMGSE